MSDLIDRQAAIDALWSLDVELRPSAIDAILNMLNGLPSAQPDWGKPVGDGRPLADGEIIARLQDIKKQIGGSYAIDRAIEVLEWLSSTQSESEHTMEEFMFGQDMGSPEDGSL